MKTKIATERNALAELAVELDKDAMIIYGSGGGGPLSSAISARQEKASRIIAELAKLQFDANGKPNMYDAFHCAIDCRAIAEEGETK